MLLGLALVVASSLGCSSLRKAELEKQLLALGKNAPAARAGVQVVEAEIEVEGRKVRAEYRYLRAGRIGSPLLVFCHGTPSSSFTWIELVHGDGSHAGLAADFDVILLEQLGHSTTRTELDDYSFQACADWVSGFLATLDLRNVTLVGQSYGGEFAWRAALDSPDRVSKLVLMNSSGIPRKDDEWLPEEVKMRDWGVARIGWMLNSRDRIAHAVQPHFAAPVPRERLEEYYLVCCNSDNWNAMIDLVRDETGGRAEELDTLTQPTLLLWGARDIAYRPERYATEFARRIPGARLVLVEDAGHYPHEERPARVASEIRAFVLESNPTGGR